MRIPEYLSPSAIMEWGDTLEKRKEFYIKRLADKRPPKLQQTQPMSVGAAFDAYIKAYLYQRIFGNDGDGVYSLDNLIEKQVESHNRDFAIEAGNICFQAYSTSGAIADLMLEIELATNEPRFEFEVRANIKGGSIIDGIPLLGKPDLSFNINDRRIIYDWKVNGYCSKSAVSPAKGYLKCRDGWGEEIAPPSRGGACQVHKDCKLERISNVYVNTAYPFEYVNTSWATQLAIYGWILGSPVGMPTIIGIEQLACKDGPAGLIRVASHRGLTSTNFELELYKHITNIWYSIQHEHVFDMLPVEASKRLCSELDGLYNNVGEHAEWFSSVTRTNKPY